MNAMDSPPTLLVLECSPRGEGSTSHRIGRLLVDGLVSRVPRLSVRVRSLCDQPLPLISADFALALMTPSDHLDARQRASFALSDELIAELAQADLLLIASPVHNYSVPVVLKAWIDHVVRVGASFRTTPQGKIGLLRDRPTLVAVAAGGAIFDDAPRQPDFFRPYIEAVLKTVGISDIRFVAFDRTAGRTDPLGDAEAWVRGWIATGLEPHGERSA